MTIAFNQQNTEDFGRCGGGERQQLQVWFGDSEKNSLSRWGSGEAKAAEEGVGEEINCLAPDCPN